MAEDKKQNLKSGLYIVATPIGNLKDITLRALEVLENVDVILCEDTRVSNKLLSHYGIKASMFPYNDHNASKVRPKILRQFEDGKSVALISDAGTPLISDPGYKLINELIEKDVYVTTLPGPSSVTAALTLAGLPTDRFLFEGFLPPKKGARVKALQEISELEATLVFLERGSRVPKVLEDMLEVLGNREIAVVREITKSFEEVRREKISEVLQYYQDNNAPKGEIVLVVDPKLEKVDRSAELDDYLKNLMKDSTLKEAVAKTAIDLNIARNKVYDRALKIKD